MGRLIGRNQVQTNAKKVYTTADIVCETYLHKKGSWMQNWKRRYFVLRKDIRSICYYDNRENLTLLGSIPLDSETVITPVPPKDASKCIISCWSLVNMFGLKREPCHQTSSCHAKFWDLNLFFFFRYNLQMALSIASACKQLERTAAQSPTPSSGSIL